MPRVNEDKFIRNLWGGLVEGVDIFFGALGLGLDVCFSQLKVQAGGF